MKVATLIAGAFIALLATGVVYAQAPFNTSTKNLLMYNGVAPAGNKYVSLSVPTGLSVNYELVYPNAVPTVNQMLSIASIAGNDYTMQWVNAVSGTGTATQVAFWSGTNVITGNNNLWYDNTNTRLGIGTNAPAQTLEVKGGNVLIDGGNQLQLQNPAGTKSSTFQSGAQTVAINYTLPALAPTATGQTIQVSSFSGADPVAVSLQWAAPGDWLLAGNGATNPPTNFLGTTDAHELIFKTGGTQRARFANADSLSLGINGNAALAPPATFVLGASGWAQSSTTNNQPGTDLLMHSGTGTGTDTTRGDIAMFVPAQGASGSTVQTLTEKFRMRSGDGFVNLGGAQTPQAPLHIANSNAGHAVVYLQNLASTGYTSIDFNNDLGTIGNVGVSNSGSTLFPGQFYFNVSQTPIVPITFNLNNSEFMSVDKNGSVYMVDSLGVGFNKSTYTQISAALDVRDSVSGTGQVARFENNFPAAANNASQLLFAGNVTTLGMTNVAAVAGMVTNISATAYAGALLFYTSSNAAPTEKMRIDSVGHVGIGQSAPTQLLEVQNGNLYLSNNNNTAAQLRFREPSTSGSNVSTFQAQAQAADLNYTLPAAFGTGGSNYVMIDAAGNGTLSWSTPSAALAGTFVQYDVTAAQAGSATRSDNLYNVAYNATATDVDAAGAVITSATHSASTHAATGLSVNATTTGAGLATGVVNTTTAGTAGSATGETISATANGAGTSKGITVSATGGTNNYAALFSAGNVGILTAAPAGLLDVSGLLTGAHSVIGKYLSLGASTFTNSTNATAATEPINSIEQPTLGASNAITTTQAYTLNIGGAPRGGTNQTITNTTALNIAAGTVSSTTTPVTSYGLQVNAQTGASGNNYTAAFLGGNVGIGQSAPTQLLEVQNGNLYLSNNNNTAAQLRFREPSTSGTNVSTFQAQAQAADLNYTLPAAFGTGGSNYVMIDAAGNGTLSWSTPSAALAGTFVQYDVTAAQAGSATRSDNLYSVAYNATATDVDAAGAVITSATHSASTHAATGLSVNATTTGAGLATGVVNTTTAGTAGSATGETISATANGAGTSKGITVSATGGTNNYAALFSAGNVGILTAAPAGLLDVSGLLTGAHSVIGKYLSLGASTFTNSTNATAATEPINSIEQPTLGASNAITTTQAYTLNIGGAPAKGTNQTLTSTTALNIASGAVVAATNSFGLQVNAQTGATNNYAAAFLGGRVGVFNAAPAGLLDVSGALSGANSAIGKYLSLTSSTFTNNSGAGTYATEPINSIEEPTLGATAATTTTQAYTLNIGGAPAKGTNQTLTNTTALNIASGAVVAATNSFGLQVNAQTGATNNYAAAFLGGRVGVFNAAPAGLLDVSGALAGANSAVGKYLVLTASTFTDNSATGTYATEPISSIEQPTLGATNAVTTTQAYTLNIGGAPLKGTNQTITNSTTLNIAAGSALTATNGYGLQVNAPTGATNNYAGAFEGSVAGNVSVLRLMNNQAAAVNNAPQIIFSDNTTTNGMTNVAAISAPVTNIGAATYVGSIILSTVNAGGALAERMRVGSGGDLTTLGVQGAAGVAPPTSVTFGAAGYVAASTASNQTGTDLIIQSGEPTGTSTTNGNIIFQTPSVAATGTTVQVEQEHLRIANAKTATNVSADVLLTQDHLITTGTNPGVATTTTASNGGSVAVDAHATDIAGIITLTIGTSGAGQATTAKVTLTFARTYANAPYVFITPANSATAAIWATANDQFYATSTTSTLVINSTGTSTMANSTAYAWYYYVIGSQ